MGPSTNIVKYSRNLVGACLVAHGEAVAADAGHAADAGALPDHPQQPRPRPAPAGPAAAAAAGLWIGMAVETTPPPPSSRGLLELAAAAAAVDCNRSRVSPLSLSRDKQTHPTRNNRAF